MSVGMCRACLTETAQTKTIRNTPLQEVYEKLSNTKLITEDGRPESVCRTCFSQLQKCHNFATMSQQADRTLTQLCRDRIKIPKGTIVSLKTRNNQTESLSDLNEINIKEELDQTESPSDLIINDIKEELDQESSSDLIINDIKEELDQESSSGLNNVETNIKEELDPIKLEIEEYIHIKEEGTENNETSEIKKNRFSDNICSHKEQTKQGKDKHIKKIICDIIKTESDLNKHSENDFRGNSYNNDAVTQSTHINSQMQKPYNCDICDKTFARKINLKAHIKIHVGEKLCACDRCGKTFPNNFQLKRHMRSHTGEKPYKCVQCDRTFSDQGYLKKHIMATHTGQKPCYVCSECKASYSHKCSLQRHMRLHTGEKPFLCDICKKALPDASLLKRHIRIHTGETPYVCDACGKSYTDKDNYKKHMRLHTGEKPYKCTFCDYKSTHSNSLKLHLKKHSKQLLN